MVPLHGRGNKGPAWEGAGLRILVFKIPKNPAADKWASEVADDSLHIGHNFIIENYGGEKHPEIWVASREGISVLNREKGGKWSSMKIGEGAPGEIKLGRVNNRRILATIEPWHGNGVVIYEEPKSKKGIWPNQMIEERLAQGHALGWADFDGDGSDELAVGWRDKKFGVAIYKKNTQGKWDKQMLDEGGMATEDLAIADLDGDEKLDIIAGGRSTSNIRIYWNERQR